ncbi:MAG: SIR2 family NAD-dependent protein deacylase [Desulfobacca sp.]|uniref:SIR2 family NAD-dependent protein deacylase n=1 Tax=Desulfobacca sp. TaxID=2067990 RepID=UPI00404A9075
MSDTDLQILRRRLLQSRDVVVLTGAGISAASGVPTFRGQDGLWRQYRAVDLATPEAFQRDPHLVWEFYHWRRRLLAPLQPNAAHLALAEMEARLPRFTLITQNIDGLHALTGSRRIIELHGNIWQLRCTGCGQVSEDRRLDLPPLPTCDICGALRRPHVVWFGEMLDPGVLAAASAAVEACDLMLVSGTSGLVQPAASLGRLAKQRGAFVAEINVEPTPQSDCYDLSLLGRAEDLMPRLLPATW